MKKTLREFKYWKKVTWVIDAYDLKNDLKKCNYMCNFNTFTSPDSHLEFEIKKKNLTIEELERAEIDMHDVRMNITDLTNELKIGSKYSQSHSLDLNFLKT